MEIGQYLELMVAKGASDIFFTTGAPPQLKVEGRIANITGRAFAPGEVHTIACSIMNRAQSQSFEENWELDMAFSMPRVGRFRVNVFRQRGETALVIRHIKEVIPTIAQLHLPAILSDLVMDQRGLILVVGTTGSGKSTTLASMIEHRNLNAAGHILTIEDPIEFFHVSKKSIVNQREVGTDTKSYGSALRRAMREAPDLILIGEVRDTETMDHAMAYADTGHLCLSTLHATSANQTLERIVNFFPREIHSRLLSDLAINLRAVVSQRLINGIDGKRVPAVEIMINTPHIADLIAKGEITGIKSAMEQINIAGMQTFDQSLYQLFTEKKITEEEALRHADSRNDLGLRIRLHRDKGVMTPVGLSLS